MIHLLLLFFRFGLFCVMPTYLELVIKTLVGYWFYKIFLVFQK